MPWSSLAPSIVLAALIAAGATNPKGTAGPAPSPSPKPATTATPTDAAAAAKLLRASINAPESVSYVGELQTIRFGTNRATATIVRIEHLAPGKTRTWYLAPEALYGDYAITSGITTYQIDTKHARIVTTRNPSLESQVSSVGSLTLINENYRTELGDPETIAGHKTLSVVLINKYTGERAERLWIDPKTALVLKKEQYRGNGAVAAQSHFEELRYTSSIPAGVFSTVVPAGYSEVAGRTYASPTTDLVKVRREAGFTAIVPKYLPEGFGLSSGDVAMVDGVRELHFTYSDGLRSLSLFENANGAAAAFNKLKPQTVQFEGHDAQYVEDGPTTLLCWEERSLHFALVSDLALHDLVDIATSVVP